MSSAGTGETKHSDDVIRCARCAHFAYFENRSGHNSPQALGKCESEPWDGNTGQWAMFPHHCPSFIKLDQDPSPS
jgi:hypothetical protein